MGVASDGILTYGIKLGSSEDGWAIAEVDEWGQWEPDWYNEEDDEAEEGLIEAASQKLLAANGFAEDFAVSDGYFERKRQAEARVGIDFKLYCHFEYPMYVLSAHSITANRGDAIEIDWAALEQRRVAEDWDGKLRAACEVLGITPTQEQPKWLLVSLMG